ncbi:hypothetical protein ACOME3_000021 [Neoechinorhynchus agilis]
MTVAYDEHSKPGFALLYHPPVKMTGQRQGIDFRMQLLLDHKASHSSRISSASIADSGFAISGVELLSSGNVHQANRLQVKRSGGETQGLKEAMRRMRDTKKIWNQARAVASH